MSNWGEDLVSRTYHDERIRQLEDQSQALEQQLRAAKEENTQLKEIIVNSKEVKFTFLGQKEENDRLQKECAMLVDKVNYITTKNLNHQERYNKLHEKYEKRRETIAMLERNKQREKNGAGFVEIPWNYSTREASLQHQNERLLNHCEQLEKENDKLRTGYRYAEQEHIMANLTCQNAKLKEENELLLESNSNLQKSFERASEAFDRVVVQRNDALQEVEMVKALNHNQASHIDMLEDTLKTYKKTSTYRRIDDLGKVIERLKKDLQGKSDIIEELYAAECATKNERNEALQEVEKQKLLWKNQDAHIKQCEGEINKMGDVINSLRNTANYKRVVGLENEIAALREARKASSELIRHYEDALREDIKKWVGDLGWAERERIASETELNDVAIALFGNGTGLWPEAYQRLRAYYLEHVKKC